MSAEAEADAPRAWRRFARRDWRRLHLLLDSADSSGAGLFLQQALEKSLKGYLIARGWELRKTHELDRLVDAASAFDSKLLRFRPLCERVSGYFLIDRYPSVDLEGPDPEQLARDLDESRQLVVALFPDERLE